MSPIIPTIWDQNPDNPWAAPHPVRKPACVCRHHGQETGEHCSKPYLSGTGVPHNCHLRSRTAVVLLSTVLAAIFQNGTPIGVLRSAMEKEKEANAPEEEELERRK
ncbi:hypothetical protein NDU88_006587 [Pleurodeles waltl]|uniref:Uncharacterized protein n=1 Tax=Pleurodeles waltl TaxID=8319 RepID=A0AAV7N1S6_PLEWA|nr:hypothetical protein NDU88_006587 [Pleurodeles waltl]